MREHSALRLLTLVANPGSGGGKTGRDLPEAVRRLQQALPNTEIRVARSQSQQDARNKLDAAAAKAQEGDAVVVMGGDGMVHLGLNACAHAQATFGIIPSGTGNDFAGALGIPKNLYDAIDIIAAGNTQRVDLARITNERGTGYVGATIGTGYDAIVNRATNNTRLRLGALSYGAIALRELKRFTPLHYRLEIDGVPRELDAILVTVCNTSMFGGGMKIAPDADHTDGLLDITIIHPASRMTLLRYLPQVYTGKFVNIPVIEQLTARRVRVDGDGMFAMGDGEELGGVPIDVEADPGALKVYVP